MDNNDWSEILFELEEGHGRLKYVVDNLIEGNIYLSGQVRKLQRLQLLLLVLFATMVPKSVYVFIWDLFISMVYVLSPIFTVSALSLSVILLMILAFGPKVYKIARGGLITDYEEQENHNKPARN